MTTPGVSAVQATRGKGREIDVLLADAIWLPAIAARFRRPGGRRLIATRVAGALAALVAVAVAALAILWGGLQPAMAVEAIGVRLDAAAIDLTAAVERHRTEQDRILVSTAPGPDGIVQRMDVRAREGNLNWAVFALANSGNEQIDRLIVVPHYRLVGSGLLWPDLGLSRVVTITSSGDRPGAPGRDRRRRLPHHARSRRGDDLRGGAAHQQADADLSVGAGRLQGQDQQHHALLRHRDRHLGPARALPHHPVRGEGQRDVPGRRRAELGGAGLYRHRLRFLGQGVRHVGGRRAGLARVRRSGAGGNAAGVPVRLSQSQSLARALCAHHHRLARDPRAPDRARAGRSVDRVGHRAAVAAGGVAVRLLPGDLSRHPRLRPRGAADPDLAADAGVDDRRRRGGDRRRHQRHRRAGAARRPGADRDADRLHGDAARLRRRHHPRHRLRRRAPCARADRRRRHDLGLGRVRRQGVHQPGDRVAARAQARLARRSGRALARGAASARPRPLPRRARQRAGAAPRPAGAGFPPAHARRPLHVVRAQGAAGGRLRRRGGAAGRHASPTSPNSRTPRSGCCTTPCTTISPACPTASCSSTGSNPCWRSPRSIRRSSRRWWSSTSTASSRSTTRSASRSAIRSC